jgi:hypothetical protein
VLARCLVGCFVKIDLQTLVVVLVLIALWYSYSPDESSSSLSIGSFIFLTLSLSLVYRRLQLVYSSLDCVRLYQIPLSLSTILFKRNIDTSSYR